MLAFFVCIGLNYNPQLLFEHSYRHWGWNTALMASLIILWIFKLRDPHNWKQKLGLGFNLTDGLGFIATTLGLLIISYFLVDYLSAVKGYFFHPKLFYFKDYNAQGFPIWPIIGDYLYYLPETFNEEIFIGALLLMGLQRNFKNLDKNIIAIGVALIFSGMHQALYKWSPVQPGILLSTETLMVLFFVGVLRNALILKTRKITYSWAIHLSFNLIFFPGYFISTTTGKFATEPERFNIVFGHPAMVLITGVLATLSIIWLNKTYKVQ